MRIAAIFFVTLLCFISVQSVAQHRPPNIIIILTDDQGYGDVGFNGCKDIPTPGIDRIAKNGTVFTSGYVSFAVCGPSRAGLITGRYQDRFGFSRNPIMAPNDLSMGLPLSQQTLADLLKQAGYATAAFGKWHLGAHKELHPNKRGFDNFYGFLGGGHRFFPEDLLPGTAAQLGEQFEYRSKLLHNTQVVDEKEYLTDALSREAVSYIRANEDKPFFIYLAYNAPHSPLQASEKYLKRFEHIKDQKRKTYAAMVSAVDDGVNSILNSLEDLKQSENTIVFFLSDNGGPIKDNGSSNGPLRGKKGDLFEGGVRVPFAVQWPGKILAGQKYDAPVISLDIFATAAELSGVKPKNPIDGVNLIPYLNGTRKDSPHDFLFWRNFDKPEFAVRSNDVKMVVRKDATFLFNINEDMSERNNLADSLQVKLTTLDQQWQVWKSKLVTPRFLGLLQDAEYNKAHPDRWKSDQ